MPDISPIASTQANVVTAAIKRAGAATGAGADFLMKMAARESSLNPSARAKTSSAAGLFQFIDQTWLGAVKAYGARHGLGEYAADIIRDGSGRLTVSGKARKAAILNLRFDPAASSAMAGELANENKAILEKRLGRAVGAAELYAAHFLGPAGAVKMLAAGASANAAEILPDAAAANRHVFYDGARARSVGEVLASIAQSMGAETSGNDQPVPSAVVSSALKIDAGSEPARRADTSSDTGFRKIETTRTAMETSISMGGYLAPRLAPVSMSAMMLSILELFDPTRVADKSNKRDKI